MPGVVVPMPVVPDWNTLKRSPVAPTNKVEVATRAWDVVVPVTWALPDCTESTEPGDEVAMPTVPVAVMRIN